MDTYALVSICRTMKRFWRMRLLLFGIWMRLVAIEKLKEEAAL